MTSPATETAASVKLPRIGLLDTARGVALLAMATYHFTWDMEFMGFLAPGTAETGWLKLYARAIASTFLFIVGISLVLANNPEIRWQSVWRRFAMIAAAAAVISLTTRFAFPREWIFFGILHCIAVVSLLGLVFLRLPLFLTVLATALLMMAWIVDTWLAPNLLRSAIFDPRYLAWIGLAELAPRPNDFVPVFPWALPFLLGLTAALIALRTSLPRKLAAYGTGSSRLARIGRHSLAFYLIHQPVLIAIAFGLSLIGSPPKPDPVQTYLRQCNVSCLVQEGEALCRSFCQCTLEKLQAENLFAAFQSGAIKADDGRILALASECSGGPQ